MKKTMRFVLAGMVLVGAGEASAQAIAEPPNWLSGNVAFTTDYAFRGISQTLREVAIQGGLDVEAPNGLYGGVWGSSLNFGEDMSGGPRAQMELDFYGGIARDVAGLTVDVGAIYYTYPGASAGRSYNFVEVTGGVGRDFGGVATQASMAFSPDYFGGSGSALHMAADLSIPLSPVFSLGLRAGRQTIEDAAAFGVDDYTYGQAGLSAELIGFTLTGAYVGTSLDRAGCMDGNLCDGRVIFTLARAR